jgi:selenocysteine lyase/cysteine desulfurase
MSMGGRKQAVRAALLRNHRLSYAQDEIVVCNGSTQALFNALLATLTPGDEVIVPAPYLRPISAKCACWAAHRSWCPAHNGLRLRAEDLQPAITPRTRWLIINNPGGNGLVAVTVVEAAPGVVTRELTSNLATFAQQRAPYRDLLRETSCWFHQPYKGFGP